MIPPPSRLSIASRCFRISASQRFRVSTSGSSLVTTLLVVTVLTIIVVAFMQSMSIERMTSRSYANVERARLAADAGISAVLSTLEQQTANERFLIVANTNRTYFFLGDFFFPGTAVATNQIGFIPLFSRADTLAANVVPQVVSADTNASAERLNTNIVSTHVNQLRPFGTNGPITPVAWIPIVQNGATNARFSYWAEDLSGYIDPIAMGALAGQRAGTNGSQELALFTIFEPTNATPPPAGTAANLIKNRAVLLTQNSMMQLVQSTNDIAALTNLTLLPRSLPAEREVIPFGKGYPDAGQPKYNLNAFVMNQDVDGLADVITRNLPNFRNRRGGFANDYVKTIAASMIDYADTNNTPLVGADYRGVDSTPFITIYYDKIEWHDQVLNSGTGLYEMYVRVTTFVQLWNLSDKVVEGTWALTRNLTDTVNYGFVDHSFNDTSKVAPGSPGQPNEPAIVEFRTGGQQPPLQPNEVRVIALPAIEYRMPGTAVPIATSSRPVINGNTSGAVTGGEFSTTWNGAPVDRTPQKTERPGKTLEYRTNPDWTGSLPSLRHDPYTTNLYQQPLGDPRSTYFLNSRISANNYEDRNAWGQMATMRPGRYLTEPTRWTDAVPFSGSPNPAPTSSAKISTSADPIALANAALKNLPTQAPARFNNSGLYQQITELGNIYEPAQWFYTNYPASGIPTNATANNRYGGGMTLRIGRPEHPKFATNGQYASQLLDLFDLEPNQQARSQLSTNRSARININTATRDALRAMVAGIQIQRDSSGTNFSLPSGVQGAFFADAVIAERANAPFFSPSDMSRLTNSLGAIFGNPAQWTGGGGPPTLTHDAALEELFAKVYPHATIRSRIFRIVAVGQALDRRGLPVATSRREIKVALMPERDTNGAITKVVPVIYESKSAN